ncbi:hypothetical protein [Sandaracinobacter sp.]|jgi:hypothetical protein|uniref:hypothetical protein n=1 Tax=Sandaracinobacter sp. TaxID=2487581 RepID=UPI0035AE6FCC
MGRRIITLLPFAASSLLLVAAISSPAVASEDKDFGCTVTQNVEVQTVDMNPRYAGTLMEGGVGKRSAAAVSRYMTGQIKALAQISGRSDLGSAGGGNTAGADPATGGK